jgi:hypothetical protein
MYGDLMLGMGMGMGGAGGNNQSWGDAMALPSPGSRNNLSSSRGDDLGGVFAQQRQSTGSFVNTGSQMQQSGLKGNGLSLGGARQGNDGAMNFQGFMSQNSAMGSAGGSLMQGTGSFGMGSFSGRQKGLGIQGGTQGIVPMDNGGSSFSSMLNGMGGNLGSLLNAGSTLGDLGGRGMLGGRSGLQQQRSGGLDLS